MRQPGKHGAKDALGVTDGVVVGDGVCDGVGDGVGVRVRVGVGVGVCDGEGAVHADAPAPDVQPNGHEMQAVACPPPE